MTTREQNHQNQQRIKSFFASHEVKGEPRQEETEEDILHWITQEITADKRMLDLLAEL